MDFWKHFIKHFNSGQKKVVQEHSLDEILTLKSGIEAQVEFGKQINLIIAITTFILSTILAPLTFYLQQSIKTVDWKHELRTMVAREDLNNAANAQEKYNILLALVQQIDKDSEDYNIALRELQDQQNYMLAGIIIPFLFLFLIFLMRYKWLSSLSACIRDAYDEKEKLASRIKIRNDEIRRKR